MDAPTPTPNTPPTWGSFEPEVIEETTEYRLIRWQQSASRVLSWTEPIKP